ncbi:hypothetical protein [Streptomyces sp. NPDC090025]|uniref:hypothetical protein n=1 Tax=Streptomyces sp. NPDC090025 TaxID=3365922 RepID=UPI0038363308
MKQEARVVRGRAPPGLRRVLCRRRAIDAIDAIDAMIVLGPSRAKGGCIVRHQRSGLRTRGVLFGGLSALLVPLLAGCVSQSRDEVLKEFVLELPACPTEAETFSGSTDVADWHLDMSFTVPRACADTYLKDHGVDLDTHLTWPASGTTVIDGVTIPPDTPPFTDGAMKRFGLSLDPKKKYALYRTFRTPKDARFRVLVVPAGDKVGLYMEVVGPGFVRGSGNAG